MKLNPDCIRDILLYCEENCKGIDGVTFYGNETIGEAKYEPSVLMEHLKQCKLSGFFKDGSGKKSWGHFLVNGLTPCGYEFLASLREPSIFEEIKAKFKENAIDATIELMLTFGKTLIKGRLGM